MIKQIITHLPFCTFVKNTGLCFLNNLNMIVSFIEAQTPAKIYLNNVYTTLYNITILEQLTNINK